MKVICQISGIPIWKSNLLLGMDLADEHPIFRMKKSLLFTKDWIHRFSHSTNVDEKRLIYLAHLNATHLVEFQHYAEPTLHTMESTFYRLQRLSEWLNFAQHILARNIAFPQFVIRFDNRNLESIRGWLDAIEEIKGKIHRNDLLRDKNAMLLAHELEIKKELGIANSVGRSFTPQLARWALEVCEITKTHPDYAKWMKILCTPLNEVWMYKMNDLEDVQEILQLGLPNVEENPQALSVMHQMNQLIRENRRGFTEFSMLDDDPAEVKDFEFITEDSDTGEKKVHKINQHLKDIPTEMPLLKNYPTKLAYLQAKARWDLDQSRKNRVIGEHDV